MLVLGINVGPALETQYSREQNFAHDAAAVLLQDSEIIAAVEEERLNRIKHCNAFPKRAIDFCLLHANKTLANIDRIAINLSEQDGTRYAQLASLEDTTVPLRSARDYFSTNFLETYGIDVASRLEFCPHHSAHAWSAFALSGLEKSIVLVLDGAGDSGRGDGKSLSGLVGVAGRDGFEILRNLTVEQSLGHLYVMAIKLIGYDLFDEYKVMGLAPYGDPNRFRGVFQQIYRLEDFGQYYISPTYVEELFVELSKNKDYLPPRRKGDHIGQIHQDFAAALQEAIELIVFHVAKHFRNTTKIDCLTYAGGVAHNCTLNGKLRNSGLFKRIFVQPAAHDAGCALGAAVYAMNKAFPNVPPAQLHTLYLGPPLPTTDSIAQRLMQWSCMLNFARSQNICREAAELLARDSVIGWVQGRSEFGPRSLGNRSILADPRPAENKARINQMIKKREGYRPFAPSILDGQVDVYFDAPGPTDNLLFMNMVVPVKESWRARLGAITHVDATARIHVVRRADNERYWQLLSEFGAITGIPILLNTSFNNNHEPIVDSIADAISCFLTTDLTHLIIDDYIVTKTPEIHFRIPDMTISTRASIKVTAGYKLKQSQFDRSWTLETNYGRRFGGGTREISQDLFKILTTCSPGTSILAICASLSIIPGLRLIDEIYDLWCKRFIILEPATATSPFSDSPNSIGLSV